MTAARPEGLLLAVRVHPRARRNEVAGWQGSVLRLRVTAAPQDGEANHAVIGLLARALSVAPSRVTLVRGAATREKLLRIDGLSLAAVRAKIPLTLPSPQGGEGRGEGPP